MRSFLADLRFAFRMLGKRPGFTTAAVLALALGIGANTAVFSVIRGVVLRPLPYKDPGRLVALWESNLKANALREHSSPPNLKDWSEQNRCFTGMAGYDRSSAVLAGEGEPEMLTTSLVTPNYFELLGVAPELGRGFTSTDARQETILLSNDLWERRFGRDPHILGRKLWIGGGTRTVIGVMPAAFRELDVDSRRPPEVWYVLHDSEGEGRRSDFLRVIARLKPGVSIGQARAEMTTVAARLRQQYPADNSAWTLEIASLAEAVSGNVRKPLWLLLGAAAVLLLIACANVANLSLARSTERRREFAIRSALGGGAARLFRQLITESAALGVVGGAAGLLLGVWTSRAMIRLGGAFIPRAADVRLDPWVMLFAFGAVCATTILFGVLPARQAARPDLNDALKSSSRGTAAGGGPLRSALVVAEVALSLVLVIAAGLLLRSFWQVESVALGFEPSRLLTAGARLPGGAKTASFLDELLQRIERLPGVISAAACAGAPTTAARHNAFAIEGRPAPAQDVFQDAILDPVTPGYFRTMGIALRSGRYLLPSDSAGAPKVAAISEALARRNFPNEDPLGHRISFGEAFLTIVGVVADVHQQGVTAPPKAQVYVPHAQMPITRVVLEIRASLDPLSLVSAVRAELRAMDGFDRPLFDVATEEQLIAANIAPRRFALTLVGLFAALALLVAIIGIYGVISYTVAESTRELGIRMVLGALESDVLRLVLRRGLALALAGIALGTVGALAVTRVMASFLFGVSASDPATFLAVAGLFIAAALAACLIPARRATNVDPMVALHYE